MIEIFHRCQFQDWSSKLSAASRGHVGEEKERKSWNSGRAMYKSVLKYIFEGMGLTPGARIVIQHITAWDHELGMACVELNAARKSNMPTLTYVGTGWGKHIMSSARTSKHASQTSWAIRSRPGSTSSPGMEQMSAHLCPQRQGQCWATEVYVCAAPGVLVRSWQSCRRRSHG